MAIELIEDYITLKNKLDKLENEIKEFKEKNRTNENVFWKYTKKIVFSVGLSYIINNNFWIPAVFALTNIFL